jgi:hypothetical protein
MSFAQVCGVVTCAVMAVMGCGNDREAPDVNQGTSSVHDARAGQGRGPDRAAPLGTLQATNARASTQSGTPVAVELIRDPHAAQSGALVVTGFTQASHGRVTMLGGKAIYTPAPGFAGDDSFRYTLRDAAGQVATGSVTLNVDSLSPKCTIAISGPSSVVRGTPVHLTAVASCNFGTPEIQWQHRTGTSGTFVTFQNFSTATSADFPTTTSALGRHQFRARVRIQGTTTQFTSNTVTTTVNANTSPCSAVVLDAPTAGSIFATGAAIALHATATCPAGVIPEFEYLVKQASDSDFTVIPGVFPAGTTYTPANAGV